MGSIITPKKTAVAILAVGLVFTALAGCGKAEKPRTDAPAAPQAVAPPGPQTSRGKPAPETLALISSEEVKLSDKPPLLPNGGFEKWQPGEPAPKGFDAPKGAKSAIRKEMKDVAEGVLAVSQTWQALDGADAFTNKFGINVEGLKPHGNYTLEITAKNPSDKMVMVTAWQETGSPASPYDRIKDALIEIPPFTKEFKTFSCPVSPNTDRPVRIFTGCNDKRGEFPVVAIWDDWKLIENK